MFDAFVLAAGLGTRLRPLTLERPKPMVPVCGIPMLEYALASCAHAGFKHVVVNAHWLPESICAYAGLYQGMAVEVVFEPEILGTGGGLKNVQSQLAERFAVINADVLSNVDLRALRDLVPERGAAMALRTDPTEAPRYGLVRSDATDTVVHLTNVAHADPVGGITENTHFTGIHAMHVDSLNLVPEGFQCIVRTAYRALVPERKVKSLVYPGIWLDVGDPEAYLEANLAALTGTLPLSIDPFAVAAWSTRSSESPPDATFSGNVWIGENAEVSGSTLHNAVIGHGAVVEPGAILRNCVVWDGANVPKGEHSRTIFTARGVHRVESAVRG